MSTERGNVTNFGTGPYQFILPNKKKSPIFRTAEEATEWYNKNYPEANWTLATPSKERKSPFTPKENKEAIEKT